MRRSIMWLNVCALVAVPVLGAASATAAPAANSTAKVRICHRTNAVTNPYVSISVAQSSVDGDAGNDKGQGDHYANHRGPVWTASLPKGADWGDIIPPIPGVHEGLNWTVAGQALWSAGCRPGNLTDTDGDNTPDLVDPDTDNDQVPDVVDPDDDGDGTTDTRDPDESPTTDTDGDTVPDTSDADDDGDGIVDSSDPDTPPPAIAPVDPSSDIDQDGKPDTSDRDDDGDGTPDAQDPDADGDTIPDVQDPDDDGDGIPDVQDPDSGPVPDEAPDTDTDGDQIPDASDTDDDGDGVRDRVDGDADGDGRPDVKIQALTSDPLPGRIVAGEETVLWREEPLTVLGVPVRARVTCRPAERSAVSGDVSADQVRDGLCHISRTARATTVTVAGGTVTLVTVRFSSPARGEFAALSETRVYRVRG